MKTKFLFSLLLSLNFYLLSSQVPQGFNYQAIARDGENNVIAGETLKIRIGILTSKPEVIYEAEYEANTNIFGLFQLVVGDPLATPVTGAFTDVDWSVKPLFIRTSIWWKGKWEDMGSAQLFSVPYALVSQSVSGLNSLSVKGETALGDSALFEVKNNLGKTVFAVYNEGVRISVSSSPGKGTTKGGFAIGGFGTDKADPQAYLKVYPDSTRVYVKDGVKGNTKGGFAIGGFGAKGTTGDYLNITPANYFIGHESGSKNINGIYNSFIGYRAGKSNIEGSSNVFIGHESGASNTTGVRNIFMGTTSGYTNNGSYNIAMGDSAGYALTTGNYNIAIGEKAGHMLTTGNANVLIGPSAGFNHTNQQFNVIIGPAAGYYLNSSADNGSYNTFMGINAGHQIRTSRDNVFLGTNAGYWLDNGRGNTFVGIDAGRSRGEAGQPHPYRPAVAAYWNTFMGYRAGYNITNGSNNVAIGYEAGYDNQNGTNNVFIGNQAGKNETTSNKLYIANSSSNPPLIYGDFSGKKLGVNTTTLNKTLNVGGDAVITGNLSATSLTAPLTGDVSGNVTGNVTGNVKGDVEGNVTGFVNGVTFGKIFLNKKDTIVSVAAGLFELSWDPDMDGGSVLIKNRSHDNQCNFWFAKNNTDSHETGSDLVAPDNTFQIIKGTNIPNGGLEIHFGQADGLLGYCSVWMQFFNGKMVGHYIKN